MSRYRTTFTATEPWNFVLHREVGREAPASSPYLGRAGRDPVTNSL